MLSAQNLDLEIPAWLRSRHGTISHRSFPRRRPDSLASTETTSWPSPHPSLSLLPSRHLMGRNSVWGRPVNSSIVLHHVDIAPSLTLYGPVPATLAVQKGCIWKWNMCAHEMRKISMENRNIVENGKLQMCSLLL